MSSKTQSEGETHSDAEERQGYRALNPRNSFDETLSLEHADEAIG
jgi:hypothetical protein